MRVGARLAGWRGDESGASAVEFAIIGLPFLMLLFGLLSVCLYFFTNFTMESAAWQAARAIRTGQLQQGQGSYTGKTTNEDRKIAFRAALCAKVPSYLDCNSKAVVIVQSNASFSGIVEPQCASSGTLTSQSAAAFNAGAASSVVLVTVCYPWSFGGKLPFMKAANLSDGSLLIQTSVAFRTEPYN
jgi:Flp pilus assembly protein TadG